MNRRGFLGGLLGGCLAAATTPYIMSGGIASGILMPVHKVWVPPAVATLRLYTGVPEYGGTLLVELPYSSLNMAEQNVSAIVQATGMFGYAELDHPVLGQRQLHEINFSSNSFVTGSILTMTNLRLVA